MNQMSRRMRAGSVSLALLMGLSLLAVGARPALACSCGDVPLENDIKDADAVFSGEVQSIDEDASVGSGIMAATGRITFAVEDSWKGVTAETVDVYGQGDGVNCFNTFEEGEAYLVYASRAKEADAPLKNVACGETKPLAGAEPDLRLLGAPAGELPETGGPAPLAVGSALLAMIGLSACAVRAVGVLNKRTRL
ncbi:MAG: hypothetical protein AVDCRST_MAG03-2079 [uncultured Rubrobacteraceae bacterium]|uniref:CbiN domain protein n=1 Tax=uncultured Rubrobacteraceae bacterium TaxID=349277 RepID=A0A6J4PGV1_9ACTN|nr:MAG: hypothetical protein AVDCRST_MAG03-2079 [uncultured Rubrobacteraceae bacterium]